MPILDNPKRWSCIHSPHAQDKISDIPYLYKLTAKNNIIAHYYPKIIFPIKGGAFFRHHNFIPKRPLLFWAAIPIALNFWSRFLSEMNFCRKMSQSEIVSTSVPTSYLDFTFRPWSVRQRNFVENVKFLFEIWYPLSCDSGCISSATSSSPDHVGKWNLIIETVAYEIEVWIKSLLLRRF